MRKNIIIGVLLVVSIILFIKNNDMFQSDAVLFPLMKNIFQIPVKDFYDDGHGALYTVLARNKTNEVTLIRVPKHIKKHLHTSTDHYLYIISGKAKGKVGSVSKTIGPGDFITLPRGVPHEVTTEGSKPLVLLQFASPIHEGDDTTQWFSTTQ